MSHTNVYRCTRCNLTFPNGQGGRMYVLDGRGTRVICPHPGEEAEVARVLGVKEKALRCPCEPNTTKKAKHHHQEVFYLALTRTGFLSDCICHDCLAQFGLDLQRDEKRCPMCSLSEVTTLHDLLGEPCPRCKEGTIGRDAQPASPTLPAFPQQMILSELVASFNPRPYGHEKA